MKRDDKLLVVDNKRIYDFYFNRLCNVAISQFDYANMPKSCNRWYFEKVLLCRGTAAFYKPKYVDTILSTGYVFDMTGYEEQEKMLFEMYDVKSDKKPTVKQTDKNFTLPTDGAASWWGTNSGFNIYGFPTKIRGIGYNSGNIETDDFVVLYDNNDLSHRPLITMIHDYALQLWQIHMTFLQNLDKQKCPFIIVADKNTKLSYENIMNKVDGFDNVIYVKNAADIESAIKTFNLNKEYIGNELLDSLKTVWNEAMHMLGITGETTKRERMLDGELQMNRQQDIITMSSRLLNRVDFCNRVNERWGLDMSVNLVSADTTFLPYIDPFFDKERKNGYSYNYTSTTKEQEGEE